MALLGLIALLAWGRGLRGSAALWLLGAAIGVQVLSWVLGYFHHPQWVDDNPQIDRLAKLFIFIAVAWWLGGSTRNTLIIWTLALVAFFVALFVRGNGLTEWIQGFQGVRAGFGIRNGQHAAMLFGTGLLGLVAFSHRCLYVRRWTALTRTLWGLAMATCVGGVIIGQTRAIWLALVIALPVMTILWIKVSLHKYSTKRMLLGVLVCITALVILGSVMGSLVIDILSQRWVQESSVIGMVLEGNFAEVPYSDIGIRIHSWRAAAEWIAERPLVGWGGEGRSLAIDHTEWLPGWVKQEFGHLHNYFIEVWVAYGVMGLAVIGTLAVWVGRATWLAWRGGVLPGDMALFGAAFFIYWLIVNQFESYNSFWTGVYVHNLVLGGLVTHYWHWQLMSRKACCSVESPGSKIQRE